MSEHSDSDNCAYCPCPAQCSHDRGEVVNSCEESDSSSDGAEKPSAQSKKKFAKKKSAPAKKVKCQGKACPGLLPSEHHPMLDCALDDFAKLVHRICYEKQLSKSSVARTLIKDLVFCNLGHHDKFIKSHSEMELTWTTMRRMALKTQRLPSTTSWNCCPARRTANAIVILLALLQR